MPAKGLLVLGAATFLMAQTHSTFYAAFEDGREAERQGHWRAALSAYRRAVALRPMSAGRVIIYGNNLLKDYYPYTRMGRCHLELKEWEAAESELSKAVAMHEAQSEIDDLARRLQEARAHAQEPVPAAPISLEPAPKAPLEAHAAIPSPPSEGRVEAPHKDPAPSAPAPSASRLHPPPPVIETRKVSPSEPKPAVPARESVAPAPPPVPDRDPRRTLLGVSAGLALLGLLLWGVRRKKTPEPHSSFRDPERVGPYRVERLLGRGGFASTYLAHHADTGLAVALKVLHPFRHDSAEFLGRFRLEARLGSLLDHPNLVRLVDPGPEKGEAWLAMEYVAGERLDEVLAARGPLPLKEAMSIVRDIASAMAHAHANGVVHRDLKPSNVMFREGRIKVMDFGISRIMDSETLTTTYAFLGTPLYAAPEAQLKTQVGPASDRYSLGMILFEMLAGAAPFQGETPFDILDQHRHSALPDLDLLRPGLPPRLVALTRSLCAKNPEERPDDICVVDCLEELLADPLI